jgi:ABC-type sugar transport system ATPase subunit
LPTKTSVYVTHDQTEAMTMGTRIVVMKDGPIQQIERPQSIYDHPVNIFCGFPYRTEDSENDCPIDSGQGEHTLK